MLIEQKYQIIQVWSGVLVKINLEKLEFSFKSHFKFKCQRLCENLWWISINYHQSIALSYSYQLINLFRMNLQLKLLEYIIYRQKLYTGIIALADQCQMKRIYWRFGLKMANIFVL